MQRDNIKTKMFFNQERRKKRSEATTRDTDD